MPAEITPFPGNDFSELDNAKVSATHWKIMFISGMGFFTDAYDLFIIGVVMALLRDLWKVGKLEEGLVESTALLASAFGALLFGRIADMLGRKRIYGVEVLVLALGAIACAFSPGIWWLIGFRFILGVGIGGDYPVSATIMAEYAGKASRGMLVTLVFAMQAAGLILGPLFASALLSTSLSHDIIWRVLVGFGAVPALAVYWARRHLKETPRYLAAAGMEEDGSGNLTNAAHWDKDKHSVSFWDGFHRLVNNNRLLSLLIGTSAAWFLMDAAYYGNTVSSPLVLSALGGTHTLLQKTLTQLGVFVIFAAPGYALSAFLMDRLGRKAIQVLGFGMMTVTFSLLAFIPNLQQSVTPFLLIYGLSFFFTEFGPNSTTFVYPSEIFPVRVRTTGHGIAAAMGKLGGFLGVFLFPPLMHWKGLFAAESAAAVASLLGMFVTIALLPETKGRSLEEIEAAAAQFHRHLAA
ncbi:MFS transporter [Acidicapsa dinghuensis]|uniref:MFS transporter n=1 Tax=Acidicapsa dinghuensis TaxID=2218256 RepID=A0ABW1EFN6_9BACT|nr:MFS transporter [Acidicapsa dinghuensis]